MRKPYFQPLLSVIRLESLHVVLAGSDVGVALRDGAARADAEVLSRSADFWDEEP